ncbi:neuralized-like protein 2 [Watersipora subatra]|uniref:neuralized-like protein 2 n=1 Tax=Watersipora subatra TaxID=2589382 RepID=UPI00355B3CF0
MQPMRFHSHHGQNIHISDDGNTATRTCSYAHGLCFGDRPLNQREIFLVEILSNQKGWSGHLRIGLTQHNPNTRFKLPQYALPDFITSLGKSWIMAITKTHKYIFRDDDLPDMDQEPGNPPRQSILGDGELIRTSCGTLKRSLLTLSKQSATATNQDSQLLPTDLGSRIGMMFTKNGKKGDLYIIVNGEEYGPVAKNIPLHDGPLWPVLDVYGTTKQIQIVQLTTSETLQTLCRDVITQQLSTQVFIEELPLPTRMKNFLKFDS